MTSIDPDSPASGPLHRQWRAMVLVFVGGVVGTLIRYVAERGFPTDPEAWPWATFVVNCVGTLVLGTLIATLMTMGPDTGRRRHTRLLVGVGFCGSLTTYSAFALESDRLLGRGCFGLGVGYIAATVLAGLAFATVGYVAGRRLPGLMGRR